MIRKDITRLEIVFDNGDVIKLKRKYIELLLIENITKGICHNGSTIHYLNCERVTIKISKEGLAKNTYYTIDGEQITNFKRLELGEIAYFKLYYVDGSSDVIQASEVVEGWGK